MAQADCSATLYRAETVDEIEVWIEYDYNPGFKGYNIGPGGPTDGAMPPEPREAEEITSCKRQDTDEEIVDELTDSEKEMLLEQANEDLINRN